MMTVILVLHFMVCLVLITAVLLQRGKGADLGAALGGGGANTMFGGRGAGNFLTKLTTGSAIIFMLTSLSLAYMTDDDERLFSAGEIEAVQAEEASAAEAGTESAPGELEEITPEEHGLEEIQPPAPAEASAGEPPAQAPTQ